MSPAVFEFLVVLYNVLYCPLVNGIEEYAMPRPPQTGRRFVLGEVCLAIRVPSYSDARSYRKASTTAGWMKNIYLCYPKIHCISEKTDR